MNYVLPTLLTLWLTLVTQVPEPGVRLDINDYIVPDTTTPYHSLRLHVANHTDSLVVIERVEPSCGCILATVQRSLIKAGGEGEIYVAVTTARLDNEQPAAVDVFTSVNRDVPLRLNIWKTEAAFTNEHE